MKQTSRIISTYSADVMGVCSALFELGGMTIMHDASGCNSTYTTHDEPRWNDMDSMVYISALTEMEAIMGDDEKLLGDIEDAVRELHPSFVAIAGTPIPTMTGFDFEAVAELAEQRTGVPCFGFPTTGMNTYVYGASMAFEGLARRLFCSDGRVKFNLQAGDIQSSSASDTISIEKNDAGIKESAPERIKVNVLGLTPLDFSINGTDASICEWLEASGFEVVSRWAMGSTLEELAHAGEADVNLVVSASGLATARLMESELSIPYVTGLPIGTKCSSMLADTLRSRAAISRNSAETLQNYAGLLNNCENEEKSSGREDNYMQAEDDIQIADDKQKDDEKPGSVIVLILGEPVTSLALANAIEAETGINTKVLCTTETMGVELRDKDRLTPDEEDIISVETQDKAGILAIIADPLYQPICPPGVEFIRLPSEAFSGRLYRSEIPNLVHACERTFKIFGK